MSSSEKGIFWVDHQSSGWRSGRSGLQRSWSLMLIHGDYFLSKYQSPMWEFCKKLILSQPNDIETDVFFKEIWRGFPQ
jgi:hypothetical protein